MVHLHGAAARTKEGSSVRAAGLEERGACSHFKACHVGRPSAAYYDHLIAIVPDYELPKRPLPLQVIAGIVVKALRRVPLPLRHFLLQSPQCHAAQTLFLTLVDTAHASTSAAGRRARGCCGGGWCYRRDWLTRWRGRMMPRGLPGGRVGLRTATADGRSAIAVLQPTAGKVGNR